MNDSKGVILVLLSCVMITISICIALVVGVEKQENEKVKLESYISNYIENNKDENCFKDGVNEILINSDIESVYIIKNDCKVVLPNIDNLNLSINNYQLLKTDAKLKLINK